jgi:hypothetical protein
MKEVEGWSCCMRGVTMTGDRSSRASALMVCDLRTPDERSFHTCPQSSKEEDNRDFSRWMSSCGVSCARLNHYCICNRSCWFTGLIHVLKVSLRFKADVNPAFGGACPIYRSLLSPHWRSRLDWYSKDLRNVGKTAYICMVSTSETGHRCPQE